MSDNKRVLVKLITTCMVCGKRVVWRGENINEEVIRASCQPCGHQGTFTVEKFYKSEGGGDDGSPVRNALGQWRTPVTK